MTATLKLEHIKLVYMQTKLQQLITSVLTNKNQLDDWQDLIDEYRSLQMDDIITDSDDDDDINQTIDLIEEHISHSRLIIYDIVDRINEFHTKIESFWT